MEQWGASHGSVGMGEMIAALPCSWLAAADGAGASLSRRFACWHMTCAVMSMQVLVAVMTMSVGIAMAEIVSSLPSSGGPYFWWVLASAAPATFRTRQEYADKQLALNAIACSCRAAHLSSKKYSPFAAWMTGELHLHTGCPCVTLLECWPATQRVCGAAGWFNLLGQVCIASAVCL